MAYVLRVRNVNVALNALMAMVSDSHMNHKHSPWRTVSPRGLETIEWKGVFITEYEKPNERVLFSKIRDANPFFHFFESLWILAGRQDVAFLTQFAPQIAKYSDDGTVFHAPYGHRLRLSLGFDQLDAAIKMLKRDHATRQVVLQIWNGKSDLIWAEDSVVPKDVPCNDLIFLKIRDNALNITVCCRSNDILWGAYGANAVQFSMIQEFIARSVGVGIGTYVQISDSFHFYLNEESSQVYKRLLKEPYSHDSYEQTAMRPYPIMQELGDYKKWLQDLGYLIEDPNYAENSGTDPFFSNVCVPLWAGWLAYKRKDYDKALKELEECAAYDWGTACQQWIQRRLEKKAAV